MKPPIIEKQVSIRDDASSGETFGRESPLYTGRHLLILKEGYRNIRKTANFMRTSLGLKVAHTADFITEPLDEERVKDADVLVYNELGVVLLGFEDERTERLETADTTFCLEPEKVIHIPDDFPVEMMDLVEPATWGIQVIGATETPYRGSGVRLAILDTGFEKQHPDFRGRKVISRSFVSGEGAGDGHGHGTHCAGIACGFVDEKGTRYGVATEAELYVGKVLSNMGSGAQAWVLNGITWAVNNGCRIISMSLGSRVAEGETYDVAYERAAQYALSKGAVTVAAAGNESKRSRGGFKPIDSPADCPSVLAVAALDAQLQVADFSNRSINPDAKVDIAAPGVKIFSSWKLPKRYHTISGTSMAAPLVAGIFALLYERKPEATPQQVIRELKALAQPLPLPAEDVGAGLCIAPQT